MTKLAPFECFQLVRCKLTIQTRNRIKQSTQFLDVLNIRINEYFDTDWYTKPKKRSNLLSMGISDITENDHNIDWRNFKILDLRERQLEKR